MYINRLDILLQSIFFLRMFTEQRKIEPIVEQDGEKLYLVIKFPDKNVSLRYRCDDDDDYDLSVIERTACVIEKLMESVRENIGDSRMCERIFDRLTYVPKDIQHRSGRMVIDLGDPWEHLITIEFLADDIQEDLQHLCDTLRTLVSRVKNIDKEVTAT